MLLCLRMRKVIWVVLSSFTIILIVLFMFASNTTDNKEQNVKWEERGEEEPVAEAVTKRIVAVVQHSVTPMAVEIDKTSEIKKRMDILQEISNKTLAQVLNSALQAQPINQRPRPQSLQVIIATTWRSGSTFLEQLLESHPGVYNHYEPLIMYGFKRFYNSDNDSTDALKLISSLLKCKYDNDRYIETAKNFTDMFSRNIRLWKVCKEKMNRALCYKKSFLEAACYLYPWTIMKLVRSGVELLQPVLADPSLNAKLIFLIRDPRAVMNSRLTIEWCHTDICDDPRLLCDYMMRDLKSSLEFQRLFPGRVQILRYEDLAMAPMDRAKKLFANLNLDFDPAVASFITEHTTMEIDVPWTTHRRSSTRVVYWTTMMNLTFVKEIQDSCSSLMRRVGYLTINSLSDVTVDKILGNPQF